MIVLSATFIQHLAKANSRALALFWFGAIVLITVALPASPARSQETPAPPVHDVVTAIDRTDIEMSGLTSVADLLSGRRNFNNFGLFRPYFGIADAAILVNGRNVSGLNFDTLPISAVERVEILDQGAIRYGGHAISGAINIVLREDAEGAEFSLGTGRPTQAGGDSNHGSALWGGALGHGHLMVGVDHTRRQEVRDDDRAFSRAKWTPGDPLADTTGVSIGGNTLVYRPGDGDSATLKSLGECDEGVYTGVLTHPAGTVCGYPFANIKWVVGFTRRSRESVFLNADHPLDDDANFFVEARTARGDSLFRYAPAVGTFDFVASEPSVKENLIANVVGLDSGNFPTDAEFRVHHRFLGHGNREWRSDLEENDLTLGVRGDLADGLQYDVHVQYYGQENVVKGTNFVSETLLNAQIESGEYDIANPLSTDLGHREAIRTTRLRLNHDTLAKYRRASAALAGKALEIPGGDLRLTAGVEVEDQEWRDIFDFRDFMNGFHEPTDALGSADSSSKGERQRASAYAEAAIPLLTGWDLILGARHDDFDDVGNAVSWRIANHYRVNRSLAFRASWDKAENPPSLRTMHLGKTFTFPRICDPENDGLCRQEKIVILGNPGLGPDRAERVSVGATARVGAFSLAADWIKVEGFDQPRRVNAQTIVDRDHAGNPIPDTHVVRHDGHIEEIRIPILQAGTSRIEGIALNAGTALETSWAALEFDVHAFRTTRDERWVLEVKQPLAFPRDRVHAVLRATRGDVTASWNVHWRSGFSTASVAGYRYRAWTGNDIALGWRNAFGMDQLDLAGGVLNVENRGPSALLGGALPSLTLDAVVGRTVFLSASVSW